MKKQLTFCITLLIGNIFFMFSSYAATSDLKTKTKQLQQVNTQITNLQQVLSSAKDKRRTLLNELKHTEVYIGQLANQLNTITQQLTVQQNELKQLQEQAKQQQLQLNQQQQLLAQQVRANYQLGKYQYVKILLNQEDPSALSRLLTYFQYVSRARIKVIGKINQTLSALLDSKQKIVVLTEKLQTLLKQQQSQQQQLMTQQNYRQKVLSQLTSSIDTKDKKLTVLTNNKHRLEQLINQLKQSAWQAQPTQAFAAMKHKLPWPTAGRPQNIFGQQIDNSTLTYNGVLIKAPSGQAIKAIYPGKVVFANWLRGFGLLLIIEHGQGFMTLYAHNNSLYKKTGDWVKSGDLIATVGDSGGNDQNGLYFEIRRNGKPLNPMAWCASTRTVA